MAEGRAVPGAAEELAALLVAVAWPPMAATDGFLGGELYRSDDERLVMVTRWRDEAAVEAYAGPGWRDTAVVLPEERRLLARPPHVWHFRQVPTP